MKSTTESKPTEWKAEDGSCTVKSATTLYGCYVTDHEADAGLLFTEHSEAKRAHPLPLPKDNIMPMEVNSRGKVRPTHYPGSYRLDSNDNSTPHADGRLQMRRDTSVWTDPLDGLVQYGINYIRRYAYLTRFATETCRDRGVPVDDINVGVHNFLEFYVLEAMAAALPTDEFNPRVSKFLEDFREYRDYFNRVFAMALRDYMFIISAGEARHSRGHTNGLRSGGIPEMQEVLGSDRATAYRKVMRDFAPSPENFQTLIKLFTSVRWSSSFGGEAWGSIVKLGANYTKLQPAVFCDSAAGIQHNGGSAFDKHQETDVLGFRLDTGTRRSMAKLFDAAKSASNFVFDLDNLIARDITDNFYVTNNIMGLLLMSPKTASLARRYVGLLERPQPKWLDIHSALASTFREATGIVGGEITYVDRCGTGVMSLPPELDPNSPFVFCANCSKYARRTEFTRLFTLRSDGKPGNPAHLCSRCASIAYTCVACNAQSMGEMCGNPECKANIVVLQGIMPPTPLGMPILQGLFPGANIAYSKDVSKWREYRHTFELSATINGNYVDDDNAKMVGQDLWVILKSYADSDRHIFRYQVYVKGQRRKSWKGKFLALDNDGKLSTLFDTLPEALANIEERLHNIKFTYAPLATTRALDLWRKAANQSWEGDFAGQSGFYDTEEDKQPVPPVEQTKKAVKDLTIDLSWPSPVAGTWSFTTTTVKTTGTYHDPNLTPDPEYQYSYDEMDPAKVEIVGNGKRAWWGKGLPPDPTYITDAPKITVVVGDNSE